jgi:hypothetical protein
VDNSEEDEKHRWHFYIRLCQRPEKTETSLIAQVVSP